MKPFIQLLLLALFAQYGQAATTYSGSWSVSTAIPDYDDPGFSSTKSITVASTAAITSVTVGLTFTGGWNGDLYAYLVHDGQIAILLNRVGRDNGAPDGFSSSGMTITLRDEATQDIHTSLGDIGSPSGTFQPDGCLIDPLFVLDSDARTNLLSVFNGGDASGNWTLFVADQSAGETSTLQSWSLSVTTVPEPSVAALLIFPIAALFRRRR